ncbi:two-component system, chemotaxis family, CheB/CheR fusion protein [Hymenobacter daecheongensis DSM 21074]|uniref:protein-glutamate O-methyltransferase n=1 Tax=Hymenobacter daecheongensis DSM 21074 TaxID=1121955 RepID=A0A1M6HZ13_9BACT|nr:CheR family methyltransferase [Hymenobacter daecheongensis]SHJ27324.1 two-component system, chemotaxis family, CheB/CheR fusion protein [Hymenobacter daecheongensis DSM 21074]
MPTTPPPPPPADKPDSAAPLPAVPAKAPRRTENGPDKFPIVSLGGSAGSLEGFERFFRNLPPASGVAFVVVSHLLPDVESDLASILQRSTDMPVIEAQDGLKVRPNHVYVIPPGKEMSILHGTLLLFVPTQPRGHRLPIDFFCQSLAKDARERAVCIIFSGMGFDGTIGLKMVMENFGMVMVQDPATAAYDSMPRSAIATEFVDYVLPAEQLPAKLLEYLSQPLMSRPFRETAESVARPAHALQKIFTLIRAQTGHDFSFYKRNTVFRRIERRMNSHQIKEFTHYVRYLQENPAEVEALFRELLIGVTRFFRDPEAFEQLRQHLLPVLRQKEPDSTIRVWAPGCSTGEEAYSLAMLLRECLDAPGAAPHLKIQIFATDINAEAIDFARGGLYPDNIAADVGPERLQRFFVKTDGGYQIGKEVRDAVVFALHNLNKDAPFTRLDLLCCRNLLIYLSAELQRNLIPVFHYALNAGGVLFLGPSENLTGFQDLFAPLDVKWKLSRRLDVPSPLNRLLNFPFSLARHPAVLASAPDAMPSSPLRKVGPFAALVQKALLQAFSPPAVVINAKGEILYVHGRTGRYLEPAPGLGTMNIFEMAREELNFEISGAVHRATTQHHDVVVDNVRVKTEAGHQLLRLSVKPLDATEGLAGLLLVAFEEVPTPRKVRTGGPGRAAAAEHGRDALVATLDKELQYTKHRLQTTIEEMEISLEELKSTNEELQSANEELQSTNEEAMTNKEEMQSLNEELMTLNMQHQSKTDELSQAANDMKNLLDATEIATIFLDNDMVIKRFTPPVARIIRLLPADVGRPITHFASNLRYDSLVRDVQQVLDRLVSLQTNIQTTTGEWYVMRIMPYRTLDNYISGAVLTFTDITALKRLEEQLQASTAYAEGIVETVREMLVVLDEELRVLSVSRSFARSFALVPEQIRGQQFRELAGGGWQDATLGRHLQALLSTMASEFDDTVVEADFAGVGHRRVLVYGRRLRREGHPTSCILLGVKIVS